MILNLDEHIQSQEIQSTELIDYGPSIVLI
jgi:hypothetical protein